MWTVSKTFLDSIPAGSRVTSSATITVNGVSTALDMDSGSVMVQDQNVHRTFRGVFSHSVLTSQELYDLLSNEGAVLQVKVGFDWGDTSETITIFTGRTSTAVRNHSEETVTLNAADYGFDLAQQTFEPSLTQPAGTTRRAAIAAIVSGGFPGVVITDTATDTGTLLAEQTWSGSRWDAISQLADDGKLQCFFAPDGSFIIRDQPTIGTPVYLLRTSEGGTITSFDRQRPLDKLYNAVIVKPATTDGSQTWSQVTVEITDTASPRHKSKVGVRALSITNVTGGVAEATAVATAKLKQVQGKTETVAMNAIANPALEIGDTVQIIAQAWNDTPTVALTHLVDGYTFDIDTWSMSIATRNLGA